MSSQTCSVVVDDQVSGTSSSSSSQPPSSSNSQNQNPHENQTLEDAFGRLSVSPFSFNLPPLDFDCDGSNGVNGPTTKTDPFDLRGLRTLQSSNLGQIQETNKTGFERHGWNNNISGAANAVISAQQNSCGGCDGDSGNSNSNTWSGSSSRTYGASGYSSTIRDLFLASQPSVWQSGYGRDFPGVPLSNGGGDQLQRKSGVGASTEFRGNGSSLPGLNGNERRHCRLHDLRGRIVLLAKDQRGSRILRQKMERLTSQEVSLVFLEMINHVAELMVDPFGNRVIQDLVEIISEQQRTLIILMITKTNLQLVKICLNQHGSCTVEKLLEYVTTQEQRALIVSGLSPGAVVLTKDIHGHRVLLNCLKHFSHEESKYLLSGLANHCYGIATDKTGCCVLQECVKYARGQFKLQLIAEIILSASLLAEDSYGNYVVQHLLSLQIPAVTESLIRQLEGTFLYLSCNKYGSNVVEKFFQCSGEQNTTRIILELLSHPNAAMLLVHPYGNYVVQSALVVSKDPIRSAIMQLIQLNYPMMRSNIYGQKILERFDRGQIRTHSHELQSLS